MKIHHSSHFLALLITPKHVKCWKGKYRMISCKSLSSDKHILWLNYDFPASTPPPHIELCHWDFSPYWLRLLSDTRVKKGPSSYLSMKIRVVLCHSWAIWAKPGQLFQHERVHIMYSTLVCLLVAISLQNMIIAVLCVLLRDFRREVLCWCVMNDVFHAMISVGVEMGSYRHSLCTCMHDEMNDNHNFP